RYFRIGQVDHERCVVFGYERTEKQRLSSANAELGSREKARSRMIQALFPFQPLRDVAVAVEDPECFIVLENPDIFFRKKRTREQVLIEVFVGEFAHWTNACTARELL